MSRWAQGHVRDVRDQPRYRWQNLGEFRMLFNAVMHWNDVKRPAPQPAASAASAEPQ